LELRTVRDEYSQSLKAGSVIGIKESWFLQSLAGVEAAEVALDSGIARIHVAASGQLDAFYTQLPRLVDAIRQLGFDAEPHFGDYEEE
jgi:hypothetical protein